ncbi:MAG TPA: hypothetical protein PLE45_09290 [Spirochaetota bacterium]|nr:hypothetical protein [Spirochaetota bacterium]HOL57559.1 hypothetical protein [Spirochaetota bacterium]HPP05045.1 hypothetical protein [Spirochaetota bacterium]
MKRVYFLLFIFLLITGCFLLDPVNLIIKNNSSYDIEVSFDKGTKNNVKIAKYKGDFFLFYPGEINLTIKIEEIDFKKEYKINLEYTKNYTFEFDIKR